MQRGKIRTEFAGAGGEEVKTVTFLIKSAKTGRPWGRFGEKRNNEAARNRGRCLRDRAAWRSGKIRWGVQVRKKG